MWPSTGQAPGRGPSVGEESNRGRELDGTCRGTGVQKGCIYVRLSRGDPVEEKGIFAPLHDRSTAEEDTNVTIEARVARSTNAMTGTTKNTPTWTLHESRRPKEACKMRKVCNRMVPPQERWRRYSRKPSVFEPPSIRPWPCLQSDILCGTCTRPCS